MTPRRSTINILGLELPVGRLAKQLIGLIAVLAVAVFVGAHAFKEWTAVLSPQEVADQLAADVSEYGLHVMESAEHEYTLFDDTRGRLAVKAYADGCLIIQRRNQVATVTKIIRDLSRPSTPPKRAAVAPVFPVVQAAGRCLSQHPGPFQWRYGRQEGCWVEVWRQYADGCEHVQLFNACSQTFDSNPDGTPRVQWTHCNH